MIGGWYRASAPSRRDGILREYIHQVRIKVHVVATSWRVLNHSSLSHCCSWFGWSERQSVVSMACVEKFLGGWTCVGCLLDMANFCYLWASNYIYMSGVVYFVPHMILSPRAAFKSPLLSGRKCEIYSVYHYLSLPFQNYFKREGAILVSKQALTWTFIQS